MKDLNISTIEHIHFIGIGGIGISAIARMMLQEGKRVSGQDMQDSEIIEELRKAGADITIGQSLGHIPKDAHLIVYTIAIENYDQDLFQELQKQNIPIRSYPQMLSVVTENKYTIAITGTHGKTTTTAMIAEIVRDAGKDPTVIVGSLLIDEKSNFIAGASEYFIVEACEYRRSFLNVNPSILVITNIDEDHLDYYKDIEDIKSAFRELVMKVPANGFIVCNPVDGAVADVIKDAAARIIDFSKYIHPEALLKVPGIHNKLNAAAAEAVGHILRIGDARIGKSLGEFKGTWRRFEFKGTLSSGAQIYDDYAHHPVEIMATLQGFRELYPRNAGWRLSVIFQPHLFSRTKALLEEFAKSFHDADTVLVLPIYQAREEDDGSVSSLMLSDKIVGASSRAFVDFEEVENYINHFPHDDHDVFVTMGAGDVYKIGEDLLEK
jgi:UDP-N-acetylmuramate--alanine ligase